MHETNVTENLISNGMSRSCKKKFRTSSKRDEKSQRKGTFNPSDDKRHEVEVNDASFLGKVAGDFAVYVCL